MDRDKRDGKHTIDLNPRKEVYLNIDYLQMGVGGDDSWGAKPLAKYSIAFKPYYYRFIIKPVQQSESLWFKYKQEF
jgi:beta-galactosidase